MVGDGIEGIHGVREQDKNPKGKADVGPSVIKAEVRITIDDVHIVPDPDQRPWYVIDGSRRLDA